MSLTLFWFPETFTSPNETLFLAGMHCPFFKFYYFILFCLFFIYFDP